MYLAALQGSGDGAGMLSVSFNAVPEPSVAMLGLLGAFGLLIRRRR
jgi:MYXO-CTERM domain-containing protein